MLRSPCTVKVAVLAFALSGCGWPPPGTMPEPDKKELFSSALLGRDYELSIFLVTGEGPHPVLLVLDGASLAGKARDALEGLASPPGFRMPLVVGINSARPADFHPFRTKDYTPVPCPESMGVDAASCGGASEFFDAVEHELLPYLEATYGANAARADRAILGGSYGGLATIYALFHRPHLFSKYVASSPSLWFADGVPLTWDEEWGQTHTDLDATLWVGFGGWEYGTITVSARIFDERIRSHDWPSLRYRQEIIPAKRHLSVSLDAPGHGVRFAWGAP